MKNKILIVGKVPPPIGGVTIHVKRLIEHLDNDGIDFKFLELNKKNILNIFLKSARFDISHLHSSNVYMRFIFALFHVNLKTKSIITFHGNLGRYSYLKNKIDLCTIRMTDIPIVLNKQSYSLASQHNRNSKLVTAFLPPKHEKKLSKKIRLSIESLKEKKLNKIYCTNAYNLSFDRYGNEIYSISKMVLLFANLKSYGLIISDPSSNYKTYIESKNIDISKNILFIDEEHSFYNVLKLTDGFIRATTTDGDSISVREALFLGKITICTDVVSRPNGTLTFDVNNFNGLQSLIENEVQKNTLKMNKDINGYKQLKEIYI